MSLTLPSPVVLAVGLAATAGLFTSACRSFFALQHDAFRWGCRDVGRELCRLLDDGVVVESARYQMLVDLAEIALSTPCTVSPLRNFMLGRSKQLMDYPQPYQPAADAVELDRMEAELNTLWVRVFLLGSLSGFGVLVAAVPASVVQSARRHLPVWEVLRSRRQKRAVRTALA